MVLWRKRAREAMREMRRVWDLSESEPRRGGPEKGGVGKRVLVVRRSRRRSSKVMKIASSISVDESSVMRPLARARSRETLSARPQLERVWSGLM